MYKFIKEQDKSNQFDFTKLTFEVDAIQADDIVREFYLFMVGCGFISKTVVDSLEQIASEYTEQDKEN